MFASRLDRSPIFRRKLAEVPFALDLPYWIDDEHFDLEFHVRHIALPKPGDWRQLASGSRCTRRTAGGPWSQSEGLNNIEGTQGQLPCTKSTTGHRRPLRCPVLGINDTSPTPPSRNRLPDGTLSGLPVLPGCARPMAQPRKPAQILHLASGIITSRRRVNVGLEHGDFHQPAEIPSTRFNGKLSPHRVVDATKSISRRCAR